jgi:signal transduction histidine kinase/FixJ family two-component response regulator
MGKQLRVLIVEDSEDDTILLLRELKRGGYDPIFEQVDTPAAMIEFLEKQTWDVLISDYSMPHFSAPEALKLLNKSGLDIPFIILSGKIGEDTAVAAMKAGAHDYIMKNNMARLVPAIERELHEAKMRREHKLAEEALKDSEAKNRALLNAIPDMIFRISRNCTIMDFKKANDFYPLIPPSKFINKKLNELFPVKVAKQAEYFLERTLQTGDTQIFEYQLESNGRLDYYDARLVVCGENEVIAIVRNITERKQAEVLRLENEELAYASKAKNEFLATVSHELRTPLTSIIGFSILLKEKKTGDLNEKQELFLDNILKSSEHLLNLISNILDMTKLEAGKIKLAIEKVSVPATLDETLGLVEQIAAKHIVVLKREIDPQLDVIEADRQRFRQILLNLLDNAIKFSKKEGGTVTLIAKKNGDNAQFSVSDTGIGIKEKDIGKLFNMFQQVDTRVSRKYPGTGLGLAISKQLAELHGGMIKVESNYDEGSTFTLFLPLKQHYNVNPLKIEQGN